MSEQEMNIIFARNLCKLIERRGITQADVANAVGVTESAVSLWCSGKNTPRMSKVDKLCSFLKCTRAALMSEDEPIDAQEADAQTMFQRLYDKHHVLFKALDSATPEELEKVEEYIKFLKTQR